jgi:NADPH-dependent ferric siderophore reductase
MAGRPIHTFGLIRTEQMTPHMVRVILGGNGFDTFTPGECTDSYVKMVFVPSCVDVAALPLPLTMDSFTDVGVSHQPTVRTYTVRRADPIAREITVTSSCTATMVSPDPGPPAPGLVTRPI